MMQKYETNLPKPSSNNQPPRNPTTFWLLLIIIGLAAIITLQLIRRFG
jgi:hypothetical protein